MRSAAHSSPYSQDLAQSDFQLFQLLLSALHYVLFNKDMEWNAWFDKFLEPRKEDFNHQDIKNLLNDGRQP